MKLLILTCLVAVALARPKYPLRYPEVFQNEPDSIQEVLNKRKILELAVVSPIQFRQENIDELKDTRNEPTEDHIMEDTERTVSGSSSSEEVVSSTTEQKDILKEDMPSQRILEELHRLNKYKLLQLEAIHDQKLIPRVKLSSHPYLEQLYRINEDNHPQLGEPVKVVTQEQAYFHLEPFQQFFQLGASPYVAWYYPPQVMQYIAHPSSHDTPEGIASEDGGKTDVMPQWW
ncbi:alpha-S1-casein isoform X1 [Vicugna pacos]|uniref:Alpha-S1-casein n=1 Tax=Vicugna pacos TaxID=30538 RepID=A0ABM5E7S8_VICPA